MKEYLIRVATPEDGKKLLEIYAPYIRETAITFEYEVPSVEAFSRRIESTLETYPYLVAEKDGEILGYAYASQFHPRAACQWDVETTVYIKQDKKMQGLGKALYEALEAILRDQNYLNLNASIAYVEADDPYVTKDSIQFHERMGYQKIGEFHKCGYKFGRWYNLIWMEKHIGEHEEYPRKTIKFTDIRGEQKDGN